MTNVNNGASRLAECCGQCLDPPGCVCIDAIVSPIDALLHLHLHIDNDEGLHAHPLAQAAVT